MTDVHEPKSRVKNGSAKSPAVARPSVASPALLPVLRVAGSDLAAFDGQDTPLLDDQPTACRRERSFRPILWSFVAFVLVPTAIVGGYLFFVSSDQYVADARFAVRPVDPDIGGLSTKSGGSDDKSKVTSSAITNSSPLAGVPNLGSENAEIVANYVHSRAVIDDVSKSLDVRAIFGRPEADVYARLADDASAESLSAFWNKMVSVYIETSSGIVSLSVTAFRRQDALDLAEAILKSSDRLVNSLSTKVRADAMKTAEDEVRRSDDEVRAALRRLTEFRDSNRLISPIQTSEATGKLLSNVLSDKIETEARLYVVQRTQGPDAPGISTLKAKLDSMNEQASRLQNQMAGSKQVSKNLAAALAEFESLELKRQFAERMYGFARDGIERARIAAIRQSVYLAVFVRPALPQDFTYPSRATDFLLVSISCLMLWACGLTISASILDHRL